LRKNGGEYIESAGCSLAVSVKKQSVPGSSAAIVKMTIQTTKANSDIETEIIETLSHTQYAC
jgi:hypothetical protein